MSQSTKWRPRTSQRRSVITSKLPETTSLEIPGNIPGNRTTGHLCVNIPVQSYLVWPGIYVVLEDLFPVLYHGAVAAATGLNLVEDVAGIIREVRPCV